MYRENKGKYENIYTPNEIRGYSEKRETRFESGREIRGWRGRGKRREGREKRGETREREQKIKIIKERDSRRVTE